MPRKTPVSPPPSGPSHRHFQDISSGDGKKLRTRGLLLDTAIAVFAQKGIEAASIVEITEAAGLSNGSFYYHFPDKAALVDAVGGAVAATLVRETDEAMTARHKGAERVAFATLFFIRQGVSNPAWGRLIWRALGQLGEFREQISAGIRKDVQIGVDQGDFDAVPSPALHAMLLGIVSAAMHELLESPTATGIETLASEAVLRVLGVRPAKARALVAESWQQMTPPTA